MDAFGKDGSKFIKMDNDTFIGVVSELWTTISKNLSGLKTSKMKLSDFSGWLADFEQSDQITSEVNTSFSHVLILCST